MSKITKIYIKKKWYTIYQFFAIWEGSIFWDIDNKKEGMWDFSILIPLLVGCFTPL